jgi:hypothetical protein
MKNNTTHAEKTSAETKSIGFDYQYYFFLWKVLSLGEGETVGLEVKDDVHTELDESTQILYQLKHTTKTKNDGSPSNLSSLDSDLWKTISNWVQVVLDTEDDRGVKYKQLSFIKKTSFILATNKSSSKGNRLINAISDFQNENIPFTEFVKEINELLGTTTDHNIIEYINRFLSVDEDILRVFITKIFFELDEDEIIDKCKKAIKADKVPENKIDDVYSALDSAIREDNFINIKKGNKINISFDDFYIKYRKHYDKGRSCTLFVRPFTEHLPSKMEEQVFIQQLLEINDISNTDMESIAEFTAQRLKLSNNMETWLSKGELTSEEVKDYRKESIIIWKNEHRKQMRKLISENDKGLEVVDCIRNKVVSISNSPLPIDLSNGTFYELSDHPQIGWREDWEKYKT